VSKVAHERGADPAIGKAELEERLGTRGDPDPVRRADQIAAPLFAIRSEGGPDLCLVTVGLEDERLADVFAAHRSSLWVACDASEAYGLTALHAVLAYGPR
jgi:hypothetical protein